MGKKFSFWPVSLSDHFIVNYSSSTIEKKNNALCTLHKLFIPIMIVEQIN